MYTASLTALVASLALTQLTTGIMVTSPTTSTVWSSGSNSQTVSWQAVSSDPTSFVIELVNQNGNLAMSPVTLVANQTTGSSGMTNSATVSYTSGNWPVGTAFQINLMSSSMSNAAILAQSQQFNITSSGSSSSSMSSMTSSMSSSMSSSTTTTSGMNQVMTPVGGSASATSTSAGDASGGIPNAVTSTKASSADEVLASPLVRVVLAAVGMLAVMF